MSSSGCFAQLWSLQHRRHLGRQNLAILHNLLQVRCCCGYALLCLVEHHLWHLSWLLSLCSAFCYSVDLVTQWRLYFELYQSQNSGTRAEEEVVPLMDFGESVVRESTEMNCYHFLPCLSTYLLSHFYLIIMKVQDQSMQQLEQVANCLQTCCLEIRLELTQVCSLLRWVTSVMLLLSPCFYSSLLLSMIQALHRLQPHIMAFAFSCFQKVTSFLLLNLELVFSQLGQDLLIQFVLLLFHHNSCV